MGVLSEHALSCSELTWCHVSWQQDKLAKFSGWRAVRQNLGGGEHPLCSYAHPAEKMQGWQH